MRIDEKIQEIEKFLEELFDFIPPCFEDYENNSLVKAAAERYFEKIAEALVDLSFRLIKEKRWESPEEEEGAFVILFKHRVLGDNMLMRLKDIKSMRNILAHKYGEINDELVFNSITEELEKDVKEFIEKIRLIQ